MRSKISILSLGCPRNLVDSEHIIGRLSSKGYKIVDIDKADVAIVNTCAFIDDAKAESVNAILKLIDLKERGKLKKIIVYGCLSQRYHDELPKELSQIDAFVGRVALDEGIERFALTPKHYAYLKICEGCINNCSFCVIHKIKGKFCSIDTRSLIEKVKALDSSKIAELNIIGQDISGYGIDIYAKYKLADLVKDISMVCNSIKWLRLLYLYPSRVDDELLKVVKEDPKVCKYLDMPIQHINDRLLKLMNRDTDKRGIWELIAKIRKTIPEAAIRTSIIVGFPSETDKEFKELLDFIREVKFDRLGAFMYSAEEGTPAYDLKGQVPEKVKKERFNAIMSLQQQVSVENNKKFLGSEIDVLIDAKEADHYL
ncbi:MAG: MiaB/RimO family radical SAM methylthiotransferase, partial [Candidatus Omnitrophota bacterium]